MSAGGTAVHAGGLWLRADVTSYPEIEVISIPNIAVVTIGTLLVLGGLAGLGVRRQLQCPATIARTLLRTTLPSESSMPLDGST